MTSKIIMNRQLHSFSWNHHRQTFFNTIFNLKKQEVFCDVTLACDGVLFPAHRLVLAMCSEFFSEILTKVHSQQSMLVLVPTVSAEDLGALLTYIYRGEIQISQANLPSIMKAAQTLKIKGLCSSNTDGIPWEQYIRCPGQKETNSMESGESDSRDSIFSVSPDVPEVKAQELSHLPQLQVKVPKIPQVEVFIDNEELSHDMLYEGEETEEEKDVKEVVNSVWMKVDEDEEEEDLDPLSVPLLTPHTLAFTSPNPDPIAFDPDTSVPLEVVFSEDSYQEQNLSTSTSTAGTSTGSGVRYTNEQKLETVKNYYHYGPAKTARIMSELLGRKMNESSVRSIARAWIRNQKANQTTFKETQQI